MWQSLILSLLIALSISMASEARSQNLLKEKYPFALLGDDYGILTMEDLALNACIAFPEPFTKESLSYPYWQCFPTQTASFACDSTGYDENEKATMAILAIVANTGKSKHDYLSRRAIDLESCRAHEQDWKRLTANRKYFCVLGSLIEIKKSESGQEEGYWVFEAFKTNVGCDSYFVGGCSLQYQIKHGCKFSR